MNVSEISSVTKTKQNATLNLSDSPDVIIFPPLLFVSAVILGVTLQFLWPIHLWPALPARIAGGILVLTGITLVRSAKQRMRHWRTNVHPGRPTTAIVDDGPYRFTRNPIYIGGTLVYLGISLLIRAFWPIPALIPFVLLLHWGVVLREERYLETKFGDAYLSYKMRVRRWI